jgi:hypothetical protein
MDLPDGSDKAEMNSLLAIGLMAHLLAKAKPAYRIGPEDRPNAAQIGAAVLDAARDAFGADVAGFKAFERKVAKGLDLLKQEAPAYRR